jgi:hypothetical protein
VSRSNSPGSRRRSLPSLAAGIRTPRTGFTRPGGHGGCRW